MIGRLLDALFASGIIVSALLVIGWFARRILAEWATAAVRHEFDAKLEALKSDLRKKEEQIVALRSGALENRSALQNATANKTLKALDDLWAAIIDCEKFNGIVATMAIINFDAVSAKIETDSKLRDAFQMMAKAWALPKNMAFGVQAEQSRPYISDPLWALFEAYRSIFQLALAKAKIIEIGVDGRTAINLVAVDKLLAAALPDQAEYIIKHGHLVHHHLLGPLRSKILEETRKMIEGKQLDVDSLRHAAGILVQADKIHSQLAQANARPPDGISEDYLAK